MRAVINYLVAVAALAAPSASLAAVSEGGIGDLLVAPTRLVLDGRKGAEVVLSNIGAEPATYRISIEFRRMTEDGGLEDVAQASDRDKLTEEMIVYAPRRVTLAPRTPQSIRVAARPGANIPDGEYRVHMLFRAIPPATPVATPEGAPQKGLSFSLIPVYGVTIPVIVRLGTLQVKAGISDVRLETKEGKRSVGLDLNRTGDRSTYGEVRVLKPGVKEPIAVQRGVAVYTEVNKRHVSVPLSESFTGDARGPVTVQYVETFDDGTNTIAEQQAVLR
jgi:hypothetical protein